MADDPQKIFRELLENIQTLQLATLDEKRLPAISYAPFVLGGEGLQVLQHIGPDQLQKG